MEITFQRVKKKMYPVDFQGPSRFAKHKIGKV